MAISGFCKFEIKKEMDAYLEAGVSHREASRLLAEALSEVYGQKVSPATIRDKEIDARKEIKAHKVVENPTIKSKPQISQEVIESTRLTSAGGKREGAGRPAAPPQEVTEAMDFAVVAISQLSRIRSRDPRREEALEKVSNWIEERRIFWRNGGHNGV